MVTVDRMMIEYAKRFGDGFPAFQIMRTRSDDEIVVIIEDCLEKGKDAYELGYVSDNEEIEY